MARRGVKRKVTEKNRRYILMPEHQRKIIPVEDVIFDRAQIVETTKDLDHWVGILLQHVPVAKPQAPAPEPPLAALRLPERDPEPEAESVEETEPEPEETKKVVRRPGRRKTRRS